MSIIDKPPSAELRADQKDSDSLPDYPELDALLTILVDQDGSIEDCVAPDRARHDVGQAVRHQQSYHVDGGFPLGVDYKTFVPQTKPLNCR